MYRLMRRSMLAACLLLVLVSAVAAGTPQTFHVQGILEDGSSNPVLDGLHSLILTGWDDSTGGSLLWMENKVVQTSGGHFSVTLDGAGPAGLLAHSGQQYLQVQVAGEAALLPRIRVASVPSALLSTRMDGDVSTQPGEMVVRPPGDPDFDLLRITAVDSTASISMGGDPDFDLLRMAAGNSGSSLVIQGDPDFDLLRITGVDSTGTVAIGDPDFDLLRMTANPSGSSLSMGGDPDFDLLRVTANDTAASLAMTGDPDFDLLRISTGSTVARIAISDPGVKVMEMSNDLDGDGVVGPFGIAVEEEGIQRVHISGGDGSARVSLNGLPPGQSVGGQITMDVDSTGGNFAIGEEGVQVVRMQSGIGGSAGGHGGGGIAIGEEGVQIVRITSDSTGSRLAVESQGVEGAVLTVNAARRTYNYFEAFPCGMRDVEIGTLGVTMSCTPGGTTTPDTAVQIDPGGNMRLDGSLAVGGNICAVGTIGVCSDARYKTDITGLQGALASLGRIRGVNFNWRTEEFSDKHFRTDRDFGFIAQELKEVVPQVVTLGSDGYYSVDYGRLTPLLVEAVKELDARTARIGELEARLASVEQARQAEMAVLTDRLTQLETQLAKLASVSSSTQTAVTLADAK